MQGEVTDLVLLDVIPHSLGIENKDGSFMPIIERNSNVPTKKSVLFTTDTDNQTSFAIHVLQGEDEIADYNLSLGKWELTGIAPSPKGKPQIEVTFEIDVNGIVQVTVLEQAKGRQESKTLLSHEEVERLRREASVGQLQGLFGSTRKTFELLSQKLTEEERAQACDAFHTADQAKDGTFDEIRSALDRLETAAEALGQAMLRG